MGAPRKGGTRRSSASVAIQTTQSILSDAVAKGVEEALKTWATFTLPSVAPQIFLAFFLYNRLRDTIKALKEYRELCKTMSPEEAAIKETERVVTRETTKAVASKITDQEIAKKTYALTGALMARPEMEKLTEGDERFKYMLLATLSQFFIGMAIGARDSFIGKTSRLIK